MRGKIIKSIFKKEIKDIFRDKKTIFSMIILPILLYPVLMIGMVQLLNYSQQKLDNTKYTIGIVEQLPAPLLENIINDSHIEIVGSKEIDENTVDAWIGVEDKKDQPIYTIYYHSSQVESREITQRLSKYLENYKEVLIEERIREQQLNPELILNPLVIKTEDRANTEEKAGYFLAQILPLLLIFGLASGAIYPAIDVMAGEKERGTIETLLTLPISNTELIVGKYLAVSVLAMLTGVLNIVSVALSIGLAILSMGSMAGEGFLGTVEFGLNQFILPLGITLVTIGIFILVIAAVSMSVCAFAKTFKEAQNYMTPLMLAIILPAYVTMIPTVELNGATATIPVMNIALLIKSVLTFQYDMGLITLVLASNIAFVFLALFTLIKIFDSEEILFGEGREFNLLQRRYNIKKGTMPTKSDSLFIFSIALLALIYIGQWLQIKFGFRGIAYTQIMFLVLALGFAFYLKTDFKKVFSLKLPQFKHIMATPILWAGTYGIAMVLAYLILPLSSHNEEVMKQIQNMLTHEHLGVNLLVVAFLPAVCEELLFRGVIYKGLENKKKPKQAILISSILFGIMHLELIRIPITALLGLSMGYLVYKTGSILLPMLFHLLNNGLAVIVQHLGVGATHDAAIDTSLTALQIAMIVGISLLLIGLARIMLKDPKKIT